MATTKKIVYKDSTPIFVDYASNDSQGNNIVDTYAKKSDIPPVIQYITGGDYNRLEEAFFNSVTVQQLATNIGRSVEDVTLLINGTYPMLAFPADSGGGGGSDLLIRVLNDVDHKQYMYISYFGLYAVQFWHNKDGTYKYDCRLERSFSDKYDIAVSGDTLTITENY